MSVRSTAKPISALRRRMIEDMLPNLSRAFASPHHNRDAFLLFHQTLSSLGATHLSKGRRLVAKA